MNPWQERERKLEMQLVTVNGGAAIHGIWPVRPANFKGVMAGHLAGGVLVRTMPNKKMTEEEVIYVYYLSPMT